MFKAYVKARLCEASTWKGLLSLLTGIGLLTLTDAQIGLIATAMVALYAAISAFLPDERCKEDVK